MVNPLGLSATVSFCECELIGSVKQLSGGKDLKDAWLILREHENFYLNSTNPPPNVWPGLNTESLKNHVWTHMTFVRTLKAFLDQIVTPNSGSSRLHCSAPKSAQSIVES